jgi:hypothetical protein
VSFLAMLVALNCVGVSLERLRRVHRVASFNLEEVSGALGRSANVVRLAELRDVLLAEGTSWEGELVAEVLDAKSEVERTALVNERLGDVASDLGWGARIPVTAARMSGMAAFGILFVTLALSISRGGVPDATDIVSIIAWGGVGVIGALSAGREADRVAAEIRRGVDLWVERVLDAVTEKARVPDS